MYSLIKENLKKVFYVACHKSGINTLGMMLQQCNIHILVYHGVSNSQHSNGYYFPLYFVSKDNFYNQMSYLRKRMNPISLFEVVGLIKDSKKIPNHSIIVTFDDGYMNNCKEAIPILDRFKIPVTIFLATGYINSGNLFPFDKHQLLLTWAKDGKLKNVQITDILSDIPSFRKSSFGIFSEALDRYWKKFKYLLAKKQFELLQPMDWISIKNLNSSLISFGAHTENHIILDNEDLSTRKKEIVESVEDIKEKLGYSKIAFSYPVGEKGCFTAQDKKIVQDAGCYCAVTGFSGSNSYREDIFSLKRRSIGLYHNFDTFLAELAGIRQRLSNLFRKEA